MDAVTLLDGGLSTELERIGAKFGGELWTGRALIEDPSIVELAHRNYVSAGAQVIITSSYQLSRQGFLEIGLSEQQADRALAEGVAVAKRAVAGSATKVAASVGPYGAVLHDGSEYRGDYSVSQAFLEDFHRERLLVLESANPDFLAIETIPNLLEARALVEVLKEFKTPAWFSFTAQSPDSLWSGESVEDAISLVSGIDRLVAVGFNCVAPEIVTGLLESANRVSTIPKIVYPNLGGIWDSSLGQWIGAAPVPLSDRASGWREAGASWIGGCCGTSSLDISLMNRTLHS